MDITKVVSLLAVYCLFTNQNNVLRYMNAILASYRILKTICSLATQRALIALEHGNRYFGKL